MDAPKIVKYENKRLSTLGPHIWNSFSKHFKAENDFSKCKKYVRVIGLDQIADVTYGPFFITSANGLKFKLGTEAVTRGVL